MTAQYHSVGLWYCCSLKETWFLEAQPFFQVMSMNLTGMILSKVDPGLHEMEAC